MIVKKGVQTTHNGEQFNVDLNHFYVNAFGMKFVSRQSETDQVLNCYFHDELVCDDGVWRVKNENDLYQEEYAKVDKIRRAEYAARVRPYLEEAEIKKHMGEQSEYDRLMDLAVQEREKIQTENPWPTLPTN